MFLIRSFLFLSFFFSFWVLFPLSGRAQASQAPAALLPEVVVTAPPESLAPNSSLTASILTRDQMEPFQPRTLGEALAPVAGLDVISYGGLGSGQFLSLRGAGSDRVLVLKDGQRLNTAQGGGVDLSSLPLAGIERVEVIRGLAPSRYGVEGLGGIVNVITTRSDREADLFRLDGGTGSFGSVKTGGQSIFHWGTGASLGLSGGFERSQGGYEFLDPVRNVVIPRTNTDFTRRTAGASLEFPLAPSWSNRLSWGWWDQDAGAPGSSEFPTPLARLATQRNDIQDRSVLTGFLPGDADSRLSLDLQAQFQDLRYTDRSFLGVPEDDRHHDRSYEARMDSQFHPGGDWRLDPSIGFRLDHLDSTSDGTRENRTAYMALEAPIFLGRFEGVGLAADRAAQWVLTPGVRLETSSLYPAFAAPRLGVLWTLDREEGLALKANAGLLVHDPSFDDLFYPATGRAAGNPDLKPEHSASGDLGLAWDPGPLSFASTLYFQSVEDLIQWTPDFAGVWRPKNISQALLYGLELEGRLAPVALGPSIQWGVDASFTQMEARDASGVRNLEGNQLVYRPEQKGSFGTSFIFWKDFQLSYRGRFVGYRYTVASDTAYIPGFFTQQLGVRVVLAKGVDVSATVYNLAGVHYFEVDDYPMPGREWEVKTSLVL